MDNVMEMVGDGSYVPTEAELKDMAQLADIPENELKVLADAVTNSEVGFEDIKMMGIQPEGEYLAYCPFAGCGGTCRGCAGYR